MLTKSSKNTSKSDNAPKININGLTSVVMLRYEPTKSRASDTMAPTDQRPLPALKKPILGTLPTRIF
jgi:hypothetical protein